MVVWSDPSSKTVKSKQMDDPASNTRQKALALNLEATTYGTFAEIGAGQEVARWFFSVGGAAGTVAKTISAYDMAVSDALYDPAQRYISRQRLEVMLELGHIEPIRGYDESYLSIRTPDVLARLQRGDSSWEQMVPAAVAEIIKSENLFGWQPAPAMSTAKEQTLLHRRHDRAAHQRHRPASRHRCRQDLGRWRA